MGQQQQTRCCMFTAAGPTGVDINRMNLIIEARPALNSSNVPLANAGSATCQRT